jgi:hypothetical protein
MAYAVGMRWLPLATLACVGGLPTAHDEQLRAMGLNVDGFNVLHDAPASTADGTDFGRVPLDVGGVVAPAFRSVRVIDPNDQGWTLDVVGDAFGLQSSGGFLDGVVCLPPSVGVHDGRLELTSNAQPDRVFRVPLRCEGTRDLQVVDFQGLALDGDTLLGNTFAGTGGLLDLATRTVDPLPTPIGRIGEPGLQDGVFAGVDGDGAFVWDGARTAIPANPASQVWVDRDGTVALFTENGQLHRWEGGAPVPIGESGLFATVLWADADARWAVTTAGNQGWTVRDLTLHDTVTDTSAPLTQPDGSRWSSGFGARGVVLSPDRTEMLLPFSSFGDVRLERIELATGVRVDLLGAVRDHLASVGSPDGNLTAWDVTPDFQHAAVVMDNVFADPGGFRQIYSGVYVIDLEQETSWLVSVGPQGEPLDFVGNGFDGQLIEQVALDPDGERVLFGHRYVTDRTTWVELP